MLTTNGCTYPAARRGPNSEVVPAVGAEPRCAAWQTWQVASFCPLAWEWKRTWAIEKTNTTAKESANTLTRLCLVLRSPTITVLRLPQRSLFRLHPASTLTLGLFRSKQPRFTESTHHRVS